MFILLLFAFIGGIVTILSPCILPILPIVLSGSLTGGKRRPLGIVTGFIVSFTFFTLFLTTLVKLLGISADALRLMAVIVVFFFGTSLLIPQFQVLMERLFSQLSGLTSNRTSGSTGFLGGVLVGISLGLVWTPCVGPIMAAMITLAATSSVSFGATLITLAYSLGTAIPLLLITYGGRQLLNQIPWLIKNTARIQKTFGMLMMLTALGIYLNVDRSFQAYILQKFPQYGTGLTQIEGNQTVKQQLERLKEQKPMLNLENVNKAPELTGGGTWINSEPLTLEKLRGKVVLVDFWTYTCINCIRTLPYLASWHDKYKDKGLVIIGIHTPEFEFEKNLNNVQKAVKDFSLTYPIVQDNDYKIWTAYNNQYWPAKYLIDKDGTIRYTHFGEGKYDETEQKIQELLNESGITLNMPVDNPHYQVESRTPELYLGYGRMQYFDSTPNPKPDILTNYALNDTSPRKHYFGFVGDWTIHKEYSQPAKGTSLQLTFEAKDVYLVMRPTNKTARIWIRLDGHLKSDNFGQDVTQGSYGGVVEVNTDRLYKLIKLTQPGTHHLYLEFIEGEVEVFAFTFG